MIDRSEGVTNNPLCYCEYCKPFICTRHYLCYCCLSIDQYMAFGISGDDTRTFMVGADVVVTWVDGDGPQAVDYYLSGRVQVSDNLFAVYLL